MSTIAGHRIAAGGGGDLLVIDSPSGSAAWLATAQELILPLMLVFWVLMLAARWRTTGTPRERSAPS